MQLAEGLASIAFMDSKAGEEHKFFPHAMLARNADINLEELEPRLFSFNNPTGACPDCDGLGVRQYFDPGKIVHNAELSLANGAIRGWDRRHLHYFHLLRALARHYHFDIETPYLHLPKRIQEAILHGSQEESITFDYLSATKKIVQRTHPFEGVIPIMQRRYQESDSETVREELAKYLSVSECHYLSRRTSSLGGEKRIY